MKFNKSKLSLVVSFICLVGFLWIAYGIYFNEPWLMNLDNYGNEFFRLDLTSEATEMVLSFTHIASTYNLIYVALFIGAILLYKKEYRSFLWFGVSMWMTALIVPYILKDVFQRARPTDGLMTRGGYSFPSGHTMGALTLYGLIIMLAVVYIKRTWLRYTIVISSLAIILLVSWSRIHLGVHFLSDIIGSMFLGLSFLLVAWWVFLRLNRERQH